METKIKRNLSGVYFRAKRGEKWDNVCFEDLTDQEQDDILSKAKPVFVIGLAKQLANTINEVGGYADIYKD